MMRPVFEAWFRRAQRSNAWHQHRRNTTNTITSLSTRRPSGLPVLQDPLDYDTRTHHTNMDTYARLQPCRPGADCDYRKAVFVYNASTRPDKLPRKYLRHDPTAEAVAAQHLRPRKLNFVDHSRSVFHRLLRGLQRRCRLPHPLRNPGFSF